MFENYLHFLGDSKNAILFSTTEDNNTIQVISPVLKLF